MEKKEKILNPREFSKAVETQDTPEPSDLDVESRQIQQALKTINEELNKNSSLSAEAKTEIRDRLALLKHENVTKGDRPFSETAKKNFQKIRDYAQDATLWAGAGKLVYDTIDWLMRIFL